MKYRDLHLPFSGVGRKNILANNTIVNCLYSPRYRLTTKVPPVMSTFWASAKRAEPESRIWQLSAKAKINNLSNSQRYFVLIQILALWHRSMMVIMDGAKWPISNNNRENVYRTSKKTYSQSTTCVRGIHWESQARSQNLKLSETAREMSLNNSQKDFVQIPMLALALWHRATRAILDYWGPKCTIN